MARPTTRETFKDYCLRKLGSPMLRINITDDQMEDCVDDALDLFFQYHYDGQIHQYVIHSLTQQEVDAGVISLNDNVYSVTSVSVVQSTSVNSGDMQVQSFFTDVISKAVGSGVGSGVSTYYTMNAKIAELNRAFKIFVVSEFNLTRNSVHITTDIGKAGDVVIIDCHLRTTPEEFTKVWNNTWMKDFVVQLFRLQWYTNLSKYSNVQLVGGVTVDAQGQISDANEKITALREQLRNDYELPPFFFMG